MTTATLSPSPSPPLQAVAPTRRRFTVAEYCALAEAGILTESERIELLDGEIITMPPIGPPHENGTDLLNRLLTYRLYDRARVRVQGSVRINDNSLPQPDIAVLRLRDDYHRQRPTPADVFLLIEVADSSLEYDRAVKLPRHAAAGIPEVWIVNLRARQVEAFANPANGVYQSRRVIPADAPIGRNRPPAAPLSPPAVSNLCYNCSLGWHCSGPAP